MSQWSGEFEDVVIWNNAHNYGIIDNTNGVTRMPERALIGSPANTRQNTIIDSNMNHRYINGILTDFPLWPWPYEETIKAEFGMEETMTEYVTRNLENYVTIESGDFVPVNGFRLSADSISMKSDTAVRLETMIQPEEATNRMVVWESMDTTIVRVDQEGLLTAMDTGTTAIVATTIDGGFRDVCTVSVIPEDEKPSVPKNLDTLLVTYSTIQLTWNASSDNVGVQYYEVYLDSVWKKTVTDTVAHIKYLKCETTFSATVKAVDFSGNRSDESEVLEVTTKECPTTTVLHALQSDKYNLSVYPQPSAGLITIESSSSDIECIEIKNLTGMTVVTEPVLGKSITLETGYVEPGFYVLTAIIDGKKVNRVLMLD
jgi:uncharacterized protein YjdB